MPRIRDIVPFIREGNYQVHQPWIELFKEHDDHWLLDGADFDPDFQRAHVWTEDKQIAYIEFCLREGRTARVLYFNCPGWQSGHKAKTGEFVLVDGKQRMEAARRFMADEIPAFGHLRSAYEDGHQWNMETMYFEINVNSLPTRADVLRWYLQMNGGGVVHTPEELDRVRSLLALGEEE